MIISSLETASEGVRRRISATVQWEQSDRDLFEIVVETDSFDPQNLRYDGLLTLCLFPALKSGERRVRIDGSVCPQLADNLRAAMALLRLWYGDKPISIEARSWQVLSPNPDAVCGMCYSGGVDSLATLRKNRLRYPESHPNFIKTGFFIYGFDIGKYGLRRDATLFERALEHGNRMAAEANMAIHPVYSNAIGLLPDARFWMYYWHSAAYIGHVQLLGYPLRRLYIASSFQASYLIPWGSHPMLDSCYSTSYMDIVHDALDLTRWEKTVMVSDWGPALRHMRVCTAIVENGINCGRCDKCVRTMLALLAMDRLKEASAFFQNDLTAESVGRIKVNSLQKRDYFRTVEKALRDRGREDLARLVARKIQAYPLHALRSRVAQTDGRFTGGLIRKVFRFARSIVRRP